MQKILLNLYYPSEVVVHAVLRLQFPGIALPVMKDTVFSVIKMLLKIILTSYGAYLSENIFNL